MTAEWVIPTLIALPMVSATIPIIAGRLGVINGRNVAAAVLVLEGLMAVWLFNMVSKSGSIVYQIGGSKLARPENIAVGIELLADQVSALLILLVVFVGITVLGFSRTLGSDKDSFYSGYMLITGGLMGILLTHDIFTLFVFLEITGLATYGLIASSRSKEAAVASLKYLMIGTVGASFYVLGIAYIYMVTGTLNMSDLANVLAGEGFINQPIYSNPLVKMGFGFMSLGLMVKSAIFPLHTWQPGAYERAPDAVTAFMAALVSTAGAYALGRIIFTVFTPEFFAVNPIAAEILIGLAGVSIIAGSVLAVMQEKIKRLLAYSSVSQFGLIIAAFGIAAHPSGSSTALLGGLIHLAGHGLLKAGLFIGAGLVAAEYNFRYIEEYAGLGEKSPGLAAAIALLGVSLVGIPPSIGFLGKWYILLGAIESGIWPIAAIIAVSTLLSLLYVAKILETIYFKDQMYQELEINSGRIKLGITFLGLLGLTAILLGFSGEFLGSFLEPFISEVYR